MRKVNLTKPPEGSRTFKRQIYNALDCCITRELMDFLQAEDECDDVTSRIYAFERACQGPAMAMQLRGFRVDLEARTKAIKALRKEEKIRCDEVDVAVAQRWTKLEKLVGECSPAPSTQRLVPVPEARVNGKLNEPSPSSFPRHKWPRGEPDETRSCERCGRARMQRRPFNALSHYDCKELFYDILGERKIYDKDHKLTTNKDALYTIGARNKSGEVRDFADAVGRCRTLRKHSSALASRLDGRDRMCASFNVGATVDARWSSSSNHKH